MAVILQLPIPANDLTPNARFYPQVISFLESRKRKSAYTQALVREMAQEPRWTLSLLWEMEKAGLIYYCTGWGWRIQEADSEIQPAPSSSPWKVTALGPGGRPFGSGRGQGLSRNQGFGNRFGRR